MLKIKFQYSDIGHRDENLDRLGHIKKDSWSLSYVIDGFDKKEPHYVDSLKNQIDKIEELPDNCSEEQILEAISNAINFEDHFLGKASVALAVCLPTKIITLTAGDTRIYLLTSLKRTLDHSRAQEMISLGRSRIDSLYKHPLRKYLTKNLKPGCGIDALTKNVHHTTEDIMICSDGIWSCFSSDKELHEAISKGHDVFTEQVLSSRQRNRDNMTILWLQR